LQTAYEQTNYKVFLEQKEILLRVGRISAEMDLLLEELKKENFAYITAANPYSVLKSEKENSKLNRELENKIKEQKYFYLKGIGVSPDDNWKEESFCIFGIDLEEGEALAKEFSQNAFLFGKKNTVTEIIWCS
jgi:UDP-N-acetyl-D-mannosaminuronic acid transferase (WecB/TagA/CpsF family)